METRLDGTSITFQAGDKHYHDGKFTGRGIHPKLQARLDQHIQNKMTAPKDLLHVLRNSNIINATNVVEPTIQQVRVITCIYQRFEVVCMHLYML